MSLKLLLEQREEMIGNYVGNFIAHRLKQGVLKKEDGGIFGTKQQMVFLLTQFLVFANGESPRDKITDVVVLKDASVTPLQVKDISGNVFPLEITSPHHGTKKNPNPPGSIKFIAPTIDDRSEWLEALTQAIELQKDCYSKPLFKEKTKENDRPTFSKIGVSFQRPSSNSQTPSPSPSPPPQALAGSASQIDDHLIETTNMHASSSSSSPHPSPQVSRANETSTYERKSYDAPSFMAAQKIQEPQQHQPLSEPHAVQVSHAHLQSQQQATQPIQDTQQRSLLSSPPQETRTQNQALAQNMQVLSQPSHSDGLFSQQLPPQASAAVPKTLPQPSQAAYVRQTIPLNSTFQTSPAYTAATAAESASHIQQPYQNHLSENKVNLFTAQPSHSQLASSPQPAQKPVQQPVQQSIQELLPPLSTATSASASIPASLPVTISASASASTTSSTSSLDHLNTSTYPLPSTHFESLSPPASSSHSPSHSKLQSEHSVQFVQSPNLGASLQSQFTPPSPLSSAAPVSHQAPHQQAQHQQNKQSILNTQTQQTQQAQQNQQSHQSQLHQQHQQIQSSPPPHKESKPTSKQTSSAQPSALTESSSSVSSTSSASSLSSVSSLSSPSVVLPVAEGSAAPIIIQLPSDPALVAQIISQLTRPAAKTQQQKQKQSQSQADPEDEFDPITDDDEEEEGEGGEGGILPAQLAFQTAASANLFENEEEEEERKTAATGTAGAASRAGLFEDEEAANASSSSGSASEPADSFPPPPLPSLLLAMAQEKEAEEQKKILEKQKEQLLWQEIEEEAERAKLQKKKKKKGSKKKKHPT
ncbi:uncharacterized protein MONOS_2475 [Monocercomonoides exilis]|uniref:uncharacterized protein n=1 Tax=Monocercomonoides exilis TaxID=2049356 RepID=UPI0035593FAB|nr:hypothetical protein MONOS_2475 [Monocercomonoides exilis]|eukprot:MONOS_2475.1-p1 / transcript=MONOS_2475.1 / gene=MONOS_2475 / organism=Monocercomonoides_exilis_PA203 / gene_product=unspecified product / transcript_product=unspecified product / location=Mono_scaffold00051:105588-108092(-) / protein_length=816 / sequence_SO=supercontig / SO=protein_coding / is_pseudo=false